MALWLNNQVTINYLEALGFYTDEINESLLKGIGFDIENNDKTCNLIQFQHGVKEGFRISKAPELILEKYELIEKEEEDEDNA